MAQPGRHGRERHTLVYVDQGYTGQQAADAARSQRIGLHGAQLPEAKLGGVLLPKRQVVARSFASATSCRCVVKDDG